MSVLVPASLVLIALGALYIAARVARLGAAPGTFLDAGGSLPGWVAIFLMPGLSWAGLGIERHLGLVSRFGLQASHVAVGLVLVAMAALLIWNRMWYITRITGLASPGAALGDVFGSVTLRVAVLALSALFALPFAADILSFAALLVQGATGGLIPRSAGVFGLALGLAVPVIVGGWRATGLTLALLSLTLLLLLPGLTLLAEITAPGPGFPARPIPVAEGILWDRLPGVVRYVAGVGKSVPAEGIFTAIAVSSAGLALLGIVLCPQALYLGQTLRAGRGLGTGAVWLTGGLAAGLPVACAPLLAARLDGGPAHLSALLDGAGPVAQAGGYLLLLLPALIAVSFLVTGAALIWTRELVAAYLLPRLAPAQHRFAARIAIGVSFFALAFMAAFLPLVSAILGSVALPLAVQMLPALAGLTFFRWVSGGAVLAGLTIGSLIVVFTEPLGLILFEALFVDLPWGRWPLGIHSAAWGLVFNLLVVALAAAATRAAPDWAPRDRLHDALLAATGVRPGGRGPLWAMALVWSFLATGPGAILGNRFFSDPIFAAGPAQALFVPSLWVWQLLFWLLGVVLVWWLAYRLGFGETSAQAVRPVALTEPPPLRAPDWLAAGLARVTGRTPRHPVSAPRRRTGK